MRIRYGIRFFNAVRAASLGVAHFQVVFQILREVCRVRGALVFDVGNAFFELAEKVLAGNALPQTREHAVVACDGA